MERFYHVSGQDADSLRVKVYTYEENRGHLAGLRARWVALLEHARACLGQCGLGQGERLGTSYLFGCMPCEFVLLVGERASAVVFPL